MAYGPAGELTAVHCGKVNGDVKAAALAQGIAGDAAAPSVAEDYDGSV
jgi:hypothetical protein